MKLVYTIALLLFVQFNTVQAEIRVVDDEGNELVFDQPVVRVVALSPHIVENLYAIGAGHVLVGGVEYSDYPEQASSLPKVGSFASLNREALLVLQADLVIAWGSGNGQAMIAQVRELGVPVYVDEPSSLSDIPRSLRNLGQLTDTNAAANLVAQQFSSQLDQLKTQYADQQKVTVLYQIWHSPIQTVNKDHVISDVIQICGGVNLFGNAISPAPIINRETVIARDPDVIIASGDNTDPPLWLENWQQWPSLKAVRNNALYHVSPDLIQRHTPRILLGTRLMCEHIDRVRHRR